MRVLGIDPGTKIAGFACLDLKRVPVYKAEDFVLIDIGVIEAPKKTELISRVGTMHHSMYELMQLYNPEVCVLEKAFFGKNPHSALTLGLVRGAFLSAAARHGSQVGEVAPTHVKKTITGNGHAKKDEIRLALQRVYRISTDNMPYDASDALAIAITFGILQSPLISTR